MKNIENTDGTAFLFPGNSIGYIEVADALRREPACRARIEQAEAAISEVDCDPESQAGRQLSDNVIIFAISCALSDRLGELVGDPDVVCGYSLGVHAMLYGAGYHDFETALKIAVDVQLCVTSAFEAGGVRYGMGAIVGLDEDEVVRLVFSGITDAPRIAVRNGRRSFVLVGRYDPLMEALEAAERAGAMKAILLQDRYGFHCSFLKEAVETMAAGWESLRIGTPRLPAISPMDARPIAAEAANREVARNLFTPLNWQAAVRRLTDRHHVRRAYEAGPGDSLQRITRHLSRKLVFLPWPEPALASFITPVIRAESA